MFPLMENNLITQETTASLKYNIATRLERAGRRKYLYVRQQIMATHGASSSTWDRWLKLKQDDTGDIPGEVLIDFANLLNTSVPQLLNPKPLKK